MSSGDETRADENRALESEKSVGDPPARQRCEINAEPVDADDRRRLAAIESPSAVGKRRRHKKNEERTKTIVGEPLPHLGEEECGEADGMSEEAFSGAALNARRRLVVSHSSG